MGWNNQGIISRPPNDKFREGMDNINWSDKPKPITGLTFERAQELIQKDCQRACRENLSRGLDHSLEVRTPDFTLDAKTFASTYASLLNILKGKLHVDSEGRRHPVVAAESITLKRSEGDESKCYLVATARIHPHPFGTEAAPKEA